MAIKLFKFDYANGEAYANFEVDTDLFTAEKAKQVLEFFTWMYDKTSDPINEVLKKYAMAVIKVATRYSYNEYGVIGDFKNCEGFYPIDGSEGLKLTYVEGYEFDEDYLDYKVS